MPVDRYMGEGLYVTEQLGEPCLYRAQSCGRGRILVTADNPLYSTRWEATAEEFAAWVLAKVVATIRTLDSAMLRAFAGGGDGR